MCYNVSGDIMKILLLEDNELIGKALVYLLNENHYEVDLCTNIKEAKEKNMKIYDLMILDITLPDGNGIDFYQDNKEIKTIFLTALDEEEDILKCFHLGCDDYITKPFKTGELLAKIKRILNKENQIKVKNIVVDLDKMIVYKDGEEITLSQLEYKILVLLFHNLDKVITREFILNQIWDESENFVEDNTLTVYIKRIRSKIGDNIIKTIKGIGYRIDSK